MREMKDSGVEWIGKIPKDWEIVPLTKQLDSIVDYRGKTPEKTEEGTFLVTAKNIKDGKICYELSKEYVREADYEEIMHRGIPQIGDILFTTEAPLGQVANVDRTDIALAQRIIKFRALSTVNNYYLKYWMLNEGLQRYLSIISICRSQQLSLILLMADAGMIIPIGRMYLNTVKMAVFRQ